MASHRWKFYRAGGVDQVALERGADVDNLADLDQKLWTALACPTTGLEFDERTLALIDTDGNGRIRPPEILAAIAWLKDVLVSRDELFGATDTMALSSIKTSTPAGKDILAGAGLILANLGKADAMEISLAEVSDTSSIFTHTKFNGDGIVPAESAPDDAIRAAIEDVMAVMGSVTDRSGKPGIDEAKADAFFAQVQIHADWLAAGQTESVRVLGDGTAAASDAYGAVRAKVDDYFARCKVASFEPRALASLNATDADLAALGAETLAMQSESVARLPLARVEADRPMHLGAGINPAWQQRVATFAKASVTPLFGTQKSVLTEAEWNAVRDKLGPHQAWLAGRPATDIGRLGDARVSALAAGGARKAIADLIARDKALESESNQLEAVEKLLRFRRDLVPLLRNFVNFAEFYGKRRGIFQAGTLYLDARSCDLCLPVEDVARHALLAGLSQAYLTYCDCVRKSDQAKRTIVAAFTAGETDNLMVGRNGIFYDRKGADWDATITKIVENPISVRQAFWAPYKRFLRLIQEHVAKRAQAADADAHKKLGDVATTTVHADEAAADKAAAADRAAADKKPKGIDIGTVAAIGVAVGGIATFFSSVLATFFGLGLWMPMGFVALLLAISGPSMLIAWLKLRQRNLGPILDANGWAVNTLARVNVPFGGALTSMATLPAGASRSLVDPFADKKKPWKLYLFLFVIAAAGLLWFFGKVDTYLPDRVKAATVLHRT
jgi:hypothetical protein